MSDDLIRVPVLGTTDEDDDWLIGVQEAHKKMYGWPTDADLPVASQSLSEATQRAVEARVKMTMLGGPGSGNWGHKGRPGYIGGSAASKSGGVASAAPPGNKGGISGLFRQDELDSLPSAVKTNMLTALDLIDSVHGFADFGTPVSVYSKEMSPDEGARLLLTDQPKILVNSNPGRAGNMPAYIVHEIGHVIDYYALGDKETAGSEGETQSPAMQKLNYALDHTASQMGMDFMLEGNMTPDGALKRTEKTMYYRDNRTGRETRVDVDLHQIADYTRKDERFARAYTQYIATRAPGGGPMLKRIYKERDELAYGLRWWEQADFVRVAAAFDDLFKEMNW